MLKQSHLHSLKLSLIAAAVALVAAGCTFEPKYERPAAPVTQTFPEGGVYANQPNASSTASNGRTANNVAAPDIGWRDFFADARLQRIVELALKNNRDNLRAWVKDPDQFKPGVRMPAMNLSDTELDQLADYLASLK